MVVSSTLNSVSFSRACLTIGKDGTIVTLETLVYYRFANNLEDFFLVYFFTSNVVKSVALLRFVQRWYENLFLILNLSYTPSLMLVLEHFSVHKGRVIILVYRSLIDH